MRNSTSKSPLLYNYLMSRLDRGFVSRGYDADAFQLGNRGALLLRHGKNKEAIPIIQRALSMRLQLSPPTINITDNHNRIAVLYNAIGAAYVGLKEIDEAQTYFDQDVAYEAITQAIEHFNNVDYQNIPYDQDGDANEIKKRDAIEIERSLSGIGVVARKSGKIDFAIQVYLQVIEFRKNWNESNTEDLGFFTFYVNLGMAYKAIENYTESIDILKQANAIFEANQEHPSANKLYIYYLVSLSELSKIYFTIEDNDQAKELINLAITLGNEKLGENHPQLARFYEIAATFTDTENDSLTSHRIGSP